MLIKKNVNPYSMRTFAFLNDDISRIIAAYYLYSALELSHKDDFKGAFNLIDFAKKLSPKYFECNKIAAFLYSRTNTLKAKEEYQLALSYCVTDNEMSTVLVLYAGFLLRINDYRDALEQLKKAETIDNENIYIKLEKAKIYSCMGSFSDAETTLNQIVYEDLQTIKEKNIYLTRKADNLKRQSEVFEQRDYEKKFDLIKAAFIELEKSEQPDKELYNYMINLLSNLCYMYFDVGVMQYLCSKLYQYDQNLMQTSKFIDLRKILKDKFNSIPEFDMKYSFLRFMIDYNDELQELDDGEGIVYSIKDSYGFIKNIKYLEGLYFKIDQQVRLGDIVRLENIFQTDKGPIAKKFSIIRNVEDKYINLY